MSIRTATIVFVALLSLVGGCTQIKEVGQKVTESGRNILDVLTQAPRKSAIKTTDQYFPDERREGINELVNRGYGRQPPYTDRYASLAQNDKDYLVRATAIRALNRSRDAKAIPIYINALNDESDLVRLEGAKALIHMPDDKAIPGLVKLVTNPNENRDVRIAAADALKYYRNTEVARALISQLGGREFGIAWQAHQSLVRLTGKDLRYDEGAWLTYVANPDKPFG
ncbi:MAG: HEAT repeat domain-containing protein [Anaerolineae bacterium]|nr:HEAT repeat domain-containing protein [Phycisphaerae bacterium]